VQKVTAHSNLANGEYGEVQRETRGDSHKGAWMLQISLFLFPTVIYRAPLLLPKSNLVNVRSGDLKIKKHKKY